MNLLGINEATKKEVLESFWKKVPEVRKRLEMSQTEFGDKVGLSRQSISSLERGTVQLTWDTFLAIMMVVRVNNEEMYEQLIKENNLANAIANLKR